MKTYRNQQCSGATINKQPLQINNDDSLQATSDNHKIIKNQLKQISNLKIKTRAIIACKQSKSDCKTLKIQHTLRNNE